MKDKDSERVLQATLNFREAQNPRFEVKWNEINTLLL